jgi:hypothetical protein
LLRAGLLIGNVVRVGDNCDRLEVSGRGLSFSEF